jgi:prepilin-type N-terminal cleavage/methylation domain-containing protein
MLKKRGKKGKKGFTLIELLIVIAIIGILAAIAIPMYQAQTVKARMTEVTNTMSNLSSAIAEKIQEDTMWPDVAIVGMSNVANIQSSLGLAVSSIARASAWSISIPQNAGQQSVVPGTEVATITATLQSCGNPVDTLDLTLYGIISGDGSITWQWRGGAGFPNAYIPRR